MWPRMGTLGCRWLASVYLRNRDPPPGGNCSPLVESDAAWESWGQESRGAWPEGLVVLADPWGRLETQPYCPHPAADQAVLCPTWLLIRHHWVPLPSHQTPPPGPQSSGCTHTTCHSGVLNGAVTPEDTYLLSAV